MTWHRRFAAFLAVELVAAVAFAAYLETRTRIPAARLDHLDAEVAEFIKHHQRRMSLSSAADWLTLAELYLTYGCFPQAEICCREAAKLAPESKHAVYLWAVALDRLGRLNDAEEKLVKAQEMGVDGASAWVRLGRIRMRREEPENAARAFRTALERDPDEISAAIGLARILLATGRPEQVADAIDPFVESRPREHAPCQLLSMAEAAQGRRQSAEAWLDKADWRPEAGHFVDSLADVDRWAASIGALRWMKEARAATAAGKSEEAASMYQMALDLNWYDRLAGQAAEAYLIAKAPEEALALLRRIDVIAGKQPHTLWMEGEAYLLLGKTGRAQDAWQESLKYRGSPAAHQRLAETFRANETLAKRHRALALYFAALDALQAGEADRTSSLLNQSLEIDPDQSMAWYFSGRAERALGRDDAAREALRRCLELDPENGRALDALAALQSSVP